MFLFFFSKRIISYEKKKTHLCRSEVRCGGRRAFGRFCNSPGGKTACTLLANNRTAGLRGIGGVKLNMKNSYFVRDARVFIAGFLGRYFFNRLPLRCSFYPSPFFFFFYGFFFTRHREPYLCRSSLSPAINNGLRRKTTTERLRARGERHWWAGKKR